MMNETTGSGDLSVMIGQHLPFLRRYARALTGAQTTGDSYALATLEAVLEDRDVLDATLSPKAALFKAFHIIWASAGAPVKTPGEETSRLEAAAQDHMSTLTPNAREALLLKTIEAFPITDVAAIMQVDAAEAEELVQIAIREMETSVRGRVMIIEDEAIIAMDIRSIVADLGHEVVGIARTRAAAVAMGAKTRPDLILSDIQLSDNSSGIDAVNDLLEQFGDIPVIFITAFPERLLTGERPEPAFLISKPYTENEVRAAVGQAMFFSSTETLKDPV
jgi:CheY-like chemotaxis protein